MSILGVSFILQPSALVEFTAAKNAAIKPIMSVIFKCSRQIFAALNRGYIGTLPLHPVTNCGVYGLYIAYQEI